MLHVKANQPLQHAQWEIGEHSICCCFCFYYRHELYTIDWYLQIEVSEDLFMQALHCHQHRWFLYHIHYVSCSFSKCLLFQRSEDVYYIASLWGAQLHFLWQCVTILLTVGVAIDRYVFIRYPFHHSKYFITHRAFFGYVALCCTISTLLILVDVVVTVFFNIVALTLLTTGVTVSIILNIALVRYIQSQAKEIRRLSNTFVHLTNQRKAAKTVTLITMLLVFAFGPMIGFMLAVMSEGMYYWKTPTDNSFIFFNWARMLVFLYVFKYCSINLYWKKWIWCNFRFCCIYFVIAGFLALFC